MSPKSENNYDVEGNTKRDIPNNQVMEDAGKVHLGKKGYLASLSSRHSFDFVVLPFI